MANRSQSNPTYLSHPRISEEFVHVDQHLRFKIHKETKKQPDLHLREERSATNIEGPSYSNRDREVENLREQVAMLQREVERNEELLWKKDEELLHQIGPSLASSHSQGDEHDMGDKYRRQDRKQPPCHRERSNLPTRK